MWREKAYFMYVRKMLVLSHYVNEKKAAVTHKTIWRLKREGFRNASLDKWNGVRN